MKTTIMDNSKIVPDVNTASDCPTTRGMSTMLVSGAMTVLALLAAASVNAQTLPYSEDFSTTTFRDTLLTTADWAGTGKVLLPMSPTLIDPFTETTTVEVLPGLYVTRDLKLADMDNDGDLDLIEGTSTTNGVYLNDGTGTFGVARAYSGSVSANTRSIAVGDVDHDGDIDFVAGNAFGRIKLYLNDGSGTAFVTQDVSSLGRETNSVELVDLDGDGFLDVIAANLGFQQNIIYWNTRDPLIPFGSGGSSGTQLDPTIQEESRRVITGDLDNDGDVDIVFMNESEPNPNDNNLQQKNRVYMNEAAQGNFRVFSTSKIAPSPGAGSPDISNSHGGALGDLNGDGYLDLVVVIFVAGETSKIYLNNQSGTVNANPFTNVGTAFTTAGNPDFAQTAILADADNDGDLDIYMIIAGHGFRNRVYFNDGLGTITGFKDVGPIGQAPLPTLGTIGVVSNDGALGDVDGDGDLDWVLGNQESQPTTGPLANMLLRSDSSNPGVMAQQLRARATSTTVDIVSAAESVSLNPLPLATSLGLGFHTSIDYWVSGNGGVNWTPIDDDGRPVLIVAGNDVRWRAELRADSPMNAATFALDQLDIQENANRPRLNRAVGDPVMVTEGLSVNAAAIGPEFLDDDGDILYYSISGLPVGSGMRVNRNDGLLLGVPNNTDTLAQPFTVVVTATDGAFSATDTFEIAVTNSNSAPRITSFPPALIVGPPTTSGATQDVLYTYNITATDPDPGGTAGLVISAPQLPSWLVLTDNGGGSATLSGTPLATDVFDPNQMVEIVVTDTSSATDENCCLFEILIANVNDAPAFTSTAPTAVTEAAAYSYTIVVVDPDSDAVTISAPTLPSWLTFTDNGDGTATLTGTPGGVDVGVHAVEIQAQEDAPAPGLQTSQAFDITVTAAGDGPVITVLGNASVTITRGATYTDAGATATDPQDGDLTAEIGVDNPVNVNTAATYIVTYTVQDSAGNTAQAQRTVIVQAPPPPPPPKSGGGGSMGLVELLAFAMFGLVAVGRRRRRYATVNEVSQA